MQLRYSTDWKIIRDKFVISGNPCGLDWPASVTDGFKRLDAGVDDSSTPAEVELFNAAEQKIDPYLKTFLADIHDIQSGKVGDATAAAATSQNPKPHVDWMDDNELDGLLGKARPKTLQDIEKDPYWWTIFGKWVYWLDYHGLPGIRAKYDAWYKDLNGAARDRLKKARGPQEDLRQEFYDAVGKVKDQLRAWEKG
jgi:hypothetical protein